MARNSQEQRVTMGEYFKRTDKDQITLGFRPANPATFDIKTIVLKELRRDQFNGSASQDPWGHLCHFQETCELQEVPDDVTEDQKKLRLFIYSLARTAKDWLYCLPSGTFQTWKELKDKFLERFFTEEQFQKRKSAITSFKQHPRDSLYQSHQKFKLLKRRCPNHKINYAELMLIFTDSMTIQQRMLLDASAGGSMRNKTLAEVEELIEQMCQNDYDKTQISDDQITNEQVMAFQTKPLTQLQEAKSQQETESNSPGDIKQGDACSTFNQLEESQKAQVMHLESIIAQFATSLEE
jgi:hypothetical protein